LPKGVAERCSNFTKDLIEIIQPKVVIALGGVAFKSIAYAFDLKIAKSLSLKNCIKNSPYKVTKESVAIFPVYHCGFLGLLSRNIKGQKKDWSRIKEYLNSP